MSSTRRASTVPAETEATDADSTTQPETEPISALLEQAQRGLLTAINGAVDPQQGHGLDIVLARQAAEVYTILFGATR